MKTSKELKELIAELSESHKQDQLQAWKLLNELLAENRVLGEVVQCLAASQPDLNVVMERLLSRKDQAIAQSPPNLAQLQAECFDRWHVHLLFAQRIEGKGL